MTTIHVYNQAVDSFNSKSAWVHYLPILPNSYDPTNPTAFGVVDILVRRGLLISVETSHGGLGYTYTFLDMSTQSRTMFYDRSRVMNMEEVITYLCDILQKSIGFSPNGQAPQSILLSDIGHYQLKYGGHASKYLLQVKLYNEFKKYSG